MKEDVKRVSDYIDKLKADSQIAPLPQSELLQVLIEIQKNFLHIPKDSISTISQAFNVSRADVYGIITFYDDLQLKDCAPTQKRVVRVCQAEACQSMGVRQLMKKLEDKYSQDTDGVTIEKVYCLGNCALAPSVMIENKCYGNASFDQIDNLLQPIN